jgi:flagellar hook-associated protein FlgK
MSEKELIEAHMGHVKQSLSDLKEQVGSLSLLKSDFQEIKSEIKKINELTNQVKQNRDSIIKVKAVGSFLSAFFTFFMGIIAIFKEK